MAGRDDLLELRVGFVTADLAGQQHPTSVDALLRTAPRRHESGLQGVQQSQEPCHVLLHHIYNLRACVGPGFIIDFAAAVSLGVGRCTDAATLLRNAHVHMPRYSCLRIHSSDWELACQIGPSISGVRNL